MNQHTEAADPGKTCVTDRVCGPAHGCGCGSTPGGSGGRKRLKAAVVGVLCVLGCLALPVTLGGGAALGGVLAGEAWLVIAGLAVASVIAVATKHRQSGSSC